MLLQHFRGRPYSIVRLERRARKNLLIAMTQTTKWAHLGRICRESRTATRDWPFSTVERRSSMERTIGVSATDAAWTVGLLAHDRPNLCTSELTGHPIVCRHFDDPSGLVGRCFHRALVSRKASPRRWMSPICAAAQFKLGIHSVSNFSRSILVCARMLAKHEPQKRRVAEWGFCGCGTS